MATKNKAAKELTATQRKDLKAIAGQMQGAFNTIHAGISADGTCMLCLSAAFLKGIPAVAVVHAALDSLPEKGLPSSLKTRKAKLFSIANAVDNGTMIPVGKDKVPTSVGSLLKRSDGTGASLQGMYSAIKALTATAKNVQTRLDELIERVAKQLSNDRELLSAFLADGTMETIEASAADMIKAKTKTK